AFSSADSINENYARELLELHTVGVNGGYTEADVVNTAKLLTGWTIDPDTGRFDFIQSRHDSSANPIMGWTRPTSGSDFGHGVDFLHYLATHPSTAEFLATKLVRRFVSDDPDPNLVSELASTYLANDTAIAPVLTQLFTHPSFLASGDAKLRRPFEQLIAMGRAVGAELAPTTAQAQIGQLAQVAVALGQPPFRWPAPNGYPDVAAAWLNTGGLLSRWNAAGDVTANTFAALQYDESAVRAGLAGRTATEIVDTIADRVLHQPLTHDGRTIILNQLGWNPSDTKDGIAIFFAQRAVITLLLVTLDNQYT
ncbi:MAG: DUF1800 domain-containing protein, partial [Acidimicrobiia bacterium]|nr:DUF1800 domain-containing protein [Acidimicrobiia bacterium]